MEEVWGMEQRISRSNGRRKKTIKDKRGNVQEEKEKERRIEKTNKQQRVEKDEKERKRQGKEKRRMKWDKISRNNTNRKHSALIVTTIER